MSSWFHLQNMSNFQIILSGIEFPSILDLKVLNNKQFTILLENGQDLAEICIVAHLTTCLVKQSTNFRLLDAILGAFLKSLTLFMHDEV